MAHRELGWKRETFAHREGVEICPAHKHDQSNTRLLKGLKGKRMQPER